MSDIPRMNSSAGIYFSSAFSRHCILLRPWGHDEENPYHYVLGHCVEAASWMAGREHDYPEQIATGFAAPDKFYYARHPDITRIVDISETVEAKIEANVCNVAKGPGGHHGSKLRANLRNKAASFHLLGNDGRAADRNYIREFVLAKDRELGKQDGVEYAEAFHYIGPRAATIGGTPSPVESYIHKNAVPL